MRERDWIDLTRERFIGNSRSRRRSKWVVPSFRLRYFSPRLMNHVYFIYYSFGCARESRGMHFHRISRASRRKIETRARDDSLDGFREERRRCPVVSLADSNIRNLEKCRHWKRRSCRERDGGTVARGKRAFFIRSFPLYSPSLSLLLFSVLFLFVSAV